MVDRASRTVGPFRQSTRDDFSTLDGKTVAVVLRQAAKQFVYRGSAVFQHEDALENVLIITLTDAQPGDPKLVISERDWKGRIIPDVKHGCEFCIIPHSYS